MADLLTAAQTQLGYAVNEAESGDIAKAVTHIAKADVYLKRLAADKGTDIQAAIDDAAAWSGTFQQALDRFNAALREKQAAQGVAVQTDTFSGFAYPRSEQIQLAKSIGVLDELGGDDYFGVLIPGTSQ